MSDQRSKKRIGSSRRRSSNQNGKSDANDEMHVDESHLMEENNESLTDLTKHQSQTRSWYPPLSEIVSNRRKLGSNRKMRVRQNVKDSIVESYHETEEEVVESSEALSAVEMKSTPLQPQGSVEPDCSSIQLIHSENQKEGTNPENKLIENIEAMTEQKGHFRDGSSDFGGNRIVIKGGTILEVKTSTQAQEEIQQKELGHGIEPVLLMSPRLEKSLYLSMVTDHLLEFGNNAAANSPGVHHESLIPQSEVVNDPGEESTTKQEELLICKTERILEGAEKFHTSRNEDSEHIKSNTHFGAISESPFILNSDLSIEKHQKILLKSMTQPDEGIQSELCAADVNEERKEAMGLLLQGRILQANYLASESDLESEEKNSSVKVMIMSEKNTAIVSVEPNNVIIDQTTVTLSAKRLSTDGTQIEHFNSSQVSDASLYSQAHNSEDVLNYEVQEELEGTQIKEVYPVDYTGEEIYDITENLDIFEKSGEDGDIEISVMEPSASKQIISNPDNMQEEAPVTQDDSEILKEINEDDDMYDKVIEDHEEAGSSEGIMENEGMNGNKSNKHENVIDSINVSNRQSNMAVYAKAMGPQPEGVTSELNKSILRGHTSDSSVVETCLLDDMSHLNSSNGQHGPSSEESQSHSVEGSYSLQSAQRDNSVSQEDRKNTEELRDIDTSPRYPSDHKDEPVQEEPSMLKYVQENSETTTREITSKPEKEDGNLKEKFEISNLKSSTKHESETMLFNQDDNSASEMQNISHLYEKDKSNSRRSPLLNQEEASQSSDIQATKEEIDIKQTLNATESLQNLTRIDFVDIGVKCDPKAEESMGAQVVPKTDEVGKICGDPAKEDHTPQLIDTMYLVTKSELLPAKPNTSVFTNASDAFDAENKEDIKKETSCSVEEVPDQDGISGADAASDHTRHPGIPNRGNQNKDCNDSANLKSTGKGEKTVSTYRNLHGREEKEEMVPKDEISESKINKGVDMKSEESLKPELKWQVEHKSNTSNLHVITEESEIDQGLTKITYPPYLLTNSFSMDIIQMGSDSESYDINHQKDINATPEEFYNRSHEDVGGLLSPYLLKDNELTIDDGYKPYRKMTNSTSGSSIRQTDDKVKGQQKREVVGKLEELKTAELLQIKKVETSLKTFFTPDDVIKENKQVYQETNEKITGQSHDQDSHIAATDQHNVDLETSQTSSISPSKAPLPEEVVSYCKNISISELLDQGNVTQPNRNVQSNVSGFVEPPHSNKVKSTEIHISTIFERDSGQQSQLSPRPPNTEDDKTIYPSIAGRKRKMGLSRRTRRSPQGGKKWSPKIEGEQEQGISNVMLLRTERTGVNEVPFEILKSNKSEGMGEGDGDPQADMGEKNKTSSEADDTRIKITITSQDSNKANRRKFGSTRANLRWPKEELFQEADNEVSKTAKDAENLITIGKFIDTEHHLTPCFKLSNDLKVLKSNMEEKIIQTFQKDREGPLDLGKHIKVSSSGKSPSYNRILEHSKLSKPEDFLSDHPSHQDTLVKLGDQLGYGRKKRSPVGGPEKCELGSHCYNVVLVGSSNVGKTSFMKRIQSGKFCSDYCSSVGIDTCMQSVRVHGKAVTLKIWDTAGQERFHSITRQVLSKAQAFLLMYDVTSFQSFSDVNYWISCIQQGASENVHVSLLGNKSDSALRQVHSHEGEVLGKEYDIEFMECSAATGENVIRSIEKVARVLSQNSDIKEECMMLHKDPPKRKLFGCC